jgi:hypothetical protein
VVHAAEIRQSTTGELSTEIAVKSSRGGWRWLLTARPGPLVTIGRRQAREK